MQIQSNRINYQAGRKPPAPATFGSVIHVKIKGSKDPAEAVKPLLTSLPETSCQVQNINDNPTHFLLHGLRVKNLGLKLAYIFKDIRENSAFIVSGDSVKWLLEDLCCSVLKKEKPDLEKLSRDQMDEICGEKLREHLEKETTRTITVDSERTINKQYKAKQTEAGDIEITPAPQDVSSSKAPKAKTPPKGKLQLVR